jgi:hypothetical protein
LRDGFARQTLQKNVLESCFYAMVPPDALRVGSSLFAIVFRYFFFCFSIAGWMQAAGDGWKQPCGCIMGLFATPCSKTWSKVDLTAA